MKSDSESVRRRSIMSLLAMTGPLSGEALLGWLLYGAPDPEWARHEMFLITITLAALEKEKVIEVSGKGHKQEHKYRLSLTDDRDWVSEVLHETTTESH